MKHDDAENSKRVAKNSIILYMRMFFLMIIGFYTSRVILKSLGVVDFGIYNVVGGVVALFSVISKSLSSACSRFLNFEMGKGDKNSLKIVFSSSLTIQIFIAIIIFILCEIFGVWFLNYKMVIPPDRLYASNWVLQFSIITFCSNLIMIPYNAAIIAHEEMRTFAFVSIYDGVTKLVIAFLVSFSPIDRLIFYSVLLCLLQLSVQYIYISYSKKHYEECRYVYIYNKSVWKELVSYSGWNFIGAASGILRNQGGNILVNLFYGPTLNASRAVSNQVLHAVNGFVSSFMIAVRPQITQSYASGNKTYMMRLIYKSSKFSYYMLFLICLPVILNIESILSLWLPQIPDRAFAFVRLTLVFTMIESISEPLITAQLATGRIKNYQLIVGGIQLLNLPISYFIFKFYTVEAETFLIVAICLSLCCLVARLLLLKNMIRLDIKHFIKNVILKIFTVSVLSSMIPVYLQFSLEQSNYNMVINILSCLLISSTIILYVGCNKSERHWIVNKINILYNKIR